MSINFKEPVDDKTIDLIEKAFGKPEAQDRKTFLYSKQLDVVTREMSEIANSANQPVSVELNPIDSVKIFSDGTRYQVTTTGWKKLDWAIFKVESGDLDWVGPAENVDKALEIAFLSLSNVAQSNFSQLDEIELGELTKISTSSMEDIYISTKEVLKRMELLKRMGEIK